MTQTGGGVSDPVRAAKWIAISLGGLVLLLGIAVFVITSVVDPNRYRGRIQAAVSDLTGRPFIIEGNLAITWYPWLGVTMGPAHLDNLSAADPGFAERARSGKSSAPSGAAASPSDPLIAWQSLTVAAKLLPLLKGQVVADRIRLERPVIHLKRDAQGRGNWEGLGHRNAGVTADKSKASPSPVIAGLQIQDGTLDYTDDKSHQQYTLTDLQSDIGEWQPGNPLPVSLKFIAHAVSLPPAGIPVSLEVPKLAVRTDPLNITAPSLSMQVAGSRLEGELKYSGADDRADGAMKVHVPSVRALATKLNLAKRLPPDPTVLGTMDLAGTLSYAEGAITARPLTVSLDGTHISGWLERTAAPLAQWRFELRGDKIDFTRYRNPDSKEAKPFELPTDALKAINANGSVLFDQVQLADTHMANVRLQFQTPESHP